MSISIYLNAQAINGLESRTLTFHDGHDWWIVEGELSVSRVDGVCLATFAAGMWTHVIDNDPGPVIEPSSKDATWTGFPGFAPAGSKETQ